MPVDQPVIGMSVKDSVPVMPRRPTPGTDAPNVLVVVFDDTGFGQLGCFGSDIATPHLDAMAAGGLRYNRFHVTSLCSPTRAALLTGRNHHAVGMGFLADMPLGFPGYDGRIPPSAMPLPRVMRDAGYSTLAVGKWHLVPRGERSAAGPFDRWPSGYGFERYYGFLQGDTNHWAPNLVCDNHYIDPPATPEEGYHLTEDLVDQAIRVLTDQNHAAPAKPFFCYLGLGAMHAPHHVAPEWVEPYRGRFDKGWERWRDEVFARQLDLGVVPAGTELPERPPWVDGWDDLSADEQRMHARQMEVFAGFLTHTDAQLGRLFEHLRTSGQLDNTIVLVLSDNGTSAEAGRSGTFNEHRFSSGMAETVEGNLALLDEWGGHRSYNHYSWGWAWAGNSPFRLWKRYAWLGGVRTPLIAHWPARIAARGEVRDAFCHVVDLAPTILDACGIVAPDVVDGVAQQRLDGASLVATFGDPAASGRATQYFEMVGSRSIYHDGWKATTDHVSQGVLDEERLLIGSRDFATDVWTLYDLRADFAEARDLSAEEPAKLEELKQRWHVEAGRNNVFPLDDGLVQRLGAIIPAHYPPGNRSVFVPGGSRVHDEQVPMLIGGFTMTATVDVAESGADGVVCAFGDWTGGYALYIVGGRARFAWCNAGTLVRAGAGADASPLTPGRHELVARYAPGAGGGVFTVACDGVEQGSASIGETLVFALQHGGAGLRLGYDVGFPVCDDYAIPGHFAGTVEQLVIETPSFGRRPSVSDQVRSALHAE